MSKHLTRPRLIQLWTAAVLLATAVSAAFGTIPGVGTTVLLVALSLAPAAIIMLLWPGAQPQTAGEIIRGERR